MQQEPNLEDIVERLELLERMIMGYCLSAKPGRH